MPGSNAGTGQPLGFMCAKCRLSEFWRYRWAYCNDPRIGFEVTGRRRYRPSFNRGGGRTDTEYVYEYRCTREACGHVGWSRHKLVRRAWERKKETPSEEGASRVDPGEERG